MRDDSTNMCPLCVQVCEEHDSARIQCGGVRAWHPCAAALPEGRVPEQEELAGAAHGHQDCAADRHPHGLRRAAPSEGLCPSQNIKLPALLGSRHLLLLGS